jgi:DUF971 family protein
VDVPERIKIDEGTRVALTWGDGAVTRLTAEQLRGACQCASCREPSGVEQTAALLEGSEPITIANAKLVGGYAISFEFTPDGHATGIYSFNTLRELEDA